MNSFESERLYSVSNLQLHEVANQLETLTMLHCLMSTDPSVSGEIREYMEDCNHCVRELRKLVETIT